MDNESVTEQVSPKKNRKILLFICSPYSKPSISQNVNNASKEYDWLLSNMGDKIVPISMVVYLHLQDVLNPRPYDEWLELCLEMLKRSEIVYVLPGESSGKDKEIAAAKMFGIPVIEGRENLIKYLDEHQELFDNEIDVIRKELGIFLYDLKRKGINLTDEKISDIKTNINKIITNGKRKIIKSILDKTLGDK